MTKQTPKTEDNLDKGQLEQKLAQAVQELRALRLRVAQQDLKDVRSIRKIRKQIARFKTAQQKG
ncbi:50S ribosomal protein L29 [Patescibacteria group bacterium]|nr:50S ribosomal protein L29 [Patescibacteria group bacterium]